MTSILSTFSERTHLDVINDNIRFNSGNLYSGKLYVVSPRYLQNRPKQLIKVEDYLLDLTPFADRVVIRDLKVYKTCFCLALNMDIWSV